MSRGYLALVLHAHLPYVRHPEHEWFLEEEWLFEAITETYLPLLRAFEELAADSVPFRLTMSISPTLAAMLDDELLQARYWDYLMRLRGLVGKELVRTADHGHLSYLAGHYRERVDEVVDLWQRHGGQLVRAFSALEARGHLDLLTCAATHGFLPLMQVHPEAVWAQIKVAVDDHARRFGRPPTGIWLPECGYFKGLDTMLADAGLRYFVADTHAMLLARPRARRGNFAPVYCIESGVAAFGRDMESSVQVWSRDHGYPGDFIYREFYRDIGFDLDLDYIGPHVQPDGTRKNTGIKYHRITGRADDKEYYDPYWARRRAEEHADDFIRNRQHQVDQVAARLDGAPPIVVAPYDAELFGHWWYEGPWWVSSLLRGSTRAQRTYELTDLRTYLRRHDRHQAVQLGQSSWGDRGFNEFWLNSTNEWIYSHLHVAAERMIELAGAHDDARGELRRALDQAARELLLAQASDWAFIMRTGTTVDYAVRRTRTHLQRFTRLYEEISRGAIDARWLEQVEYIDAIFPALDYRVYRPRK